jgi:hypothetical protein
MWSRQFRQFSADCIVFAATTHVSHENFFTADAAVADLVRDHVVHRGVISSIGDKANIRTSSCRRIRLQGCTVRTPGAPLGISWRVRVCSRTAQLESTDTISLRHSGQLVSWV